MQCAWRFLPLPLPFHRLIASSEFCSQSLQLTNCLAADHESGAVSQTPSNSVRCIQCLASTGKPSFAPYVYLAAKMDDQATPAVALIARIADDRRNVGFEAIPRRSPRGARGLLRAGPSNMPKVGLGSKSDLPHPSALRLECGGKQTFSPEYRQCGHDRT